MKNLTVILISLLALLSPVQALAVNDINMANVQISASAPSPSLILQFSQPPRWQQVLEELQARELDASWAQLTKPSEQAQLEQLRSELLSDLHTLGQTWARQGKYTLLNSAVAMAAQLTSLPLVARQDVSMSLDQVRLNANLNPLLRGDYQLQLAPRPDSVFAQGLVRLPGKRPFVNGGFAYDYGRRLSLLAGAEKNLVWIIQPDGQVMSSPVDPFSPEFIGVAPGATLYVGFAKLPKKFADLNQRIMTLFANREI